MSVSEDDLRRSSLPRPSIWRLGIAVAVFELLSTLLLELRLGIGLSFAVSFCGGVAFFLSWPFLVVVVRTIPRTIQRLSHALVVRLLDRRTYRFSLVTLFIIVLFVAIPLAWYGAQLRRVQAEHHRLEGRWYWIHDDGTKFLMDDGEPYILDLAQDDFSVDPSREPKHLDLYDEDYTSRTIYRWEGKDRFRMIWRPAVPVSSGLERPMSFEDTGFFQTLHERVPER